MNNLRIDCEEEGFDASLLERYGTEGVESDTPLSCEIVFCGEEEIRELNARTRGKDAVTDVLSFPALDGIRGKALRAAEHPFDMDDEGALFLGSIVICREQARRQAEEFGHSLRREQCYLAVHGLCHLLGYDHETDGDKAEMRAREERVLAAMGAAREEE